MPIPATLPITDDVSLRPPTLEDGPALERLITANREHLLPWMPWAQRGYDPDWIPASLAAMSAGRAANFLFVAGGEPVGTIGFHAFDRADRSTSIGYWLAAEAQGRGLATLGVRALCRFAFAQCDVHRVELRAAPANLRSQAVAERCGFAREGVAREAERFGDGFRDLVVFSLLATDG